MKFLIVLLGAILACSAELSEEEMTKMMDKFNECKAETGAPMMGTDMFSKNISDDPKDKELMFCMAKKFGIQNEAGEVQPAAIRTHLMKFFDESKVDEIVEKCAVQKDTPQETAYSGIKCVAEFAVK